MTEPDDAQVTYPVRELLAQIRTEQAAGFARIETAMAGKADKADVARLETRLDGHAKDIANLQQWQHDKEVASGVHVQRDQRWSTKTKTVWVIVTTLLLILATAFGPVLASAIT